MHTRPTDLNLILRDANDMRARWQIEARRALEQGDDDYEVACEYQICLIDGLIALIRGELLH